MSRRRLGFEDAKARMGYLNWAIENETDVIRRLFMIQERIDLREQFMLQ